MTINNIPIKSPKFQIFIKTISIKFIFLFLIISSLHFNAQNTGNIKTSTYFFNTTIKELENNYYNFSATLLSIYVPQSKQTFKQYLETGKIDSNLIVTNFDYSPLSNSIISIYTTNINNPQDRALICTFTTNQDGKGSCIGSLQISTQTEIQFVYEGDVFHSPTQFYTVLPGSFTVPPLKDLVDSSWLIVFFVIGVLIAALYAAGRNPAAMFDITTPKVKGIRAPKPYKIRLSGKGKILSAIAASAASARSLTSRLWSKANMDINFLKAVNTAERYIPNAKEKLKDVYMSNSSDAAAKLSEKISKEGVRSKLINMISSSSRKLKNAEQRKKKLETLEKKAKYEHEIQRIREMKKKVDSEIQNYTQQIKEYENDLKNLSAARLISIAGIENLDINKFEEARNSIDRRILSEFVRYIDKQKDAKIDFVELRKETLQRVDLMNVDNLQARENINKILQAKLELDCLYVAQAIEILNKLQSNYDSLSNETKSKLNDLLSNLKSKRDELSILNEIRSDLTKINVKEIGIDNYVKKVEDTIRLLDQYGELDQYGIHLYLQLKNAKNPEDRLNAAVELEEKYKISLKDQISKMGIKEYTKKIEEVIYKLDKEGNSLYSELLNLNQKQESDKKQLSSEEESRRLNISMELEEKYNLLGLDSLSSFTNITRSLNHFERLLDKFEHDFSNYTLQASKQEQYAFNSLIDFSILSKQSSDYLNEIRTKDVYNLSPKVDENSAVSMFSLYARRSDPDEVYDVLYNFYMSPFSKENTVEFAKERIKFFEDKKEGRTVFDTTFNQIWYLQINPKEEYLNLDMKLIGYYGVDKALTKMEAEKILLSDKPDSDGKRTALDYINYFISTYSSKKIGYERKKEIGYEKKKEIGYEEKPRLEYKKSGKDEEEK